MSFLMHFFAPDWRIAEELARDEPLLKVSISRFIDAHKIKVAATEGIEEGGSIERALPPMRMALADELAMISGSEKTEKEIVDELSSFSHDEHSATLTQLAQKIKDDSMRCQYVYRLLQELYGILTDQAHIVACLSKGASDNRIIRGLVEKIALEDQVIKQLTQQQDFIVFFQRLARGERKKHELQHLESDFAEDLYERLLMVAEAQNTKLPVSARQLERLTTSIFSHIMDLVMNGVNSGELDQHPNLDLEFVNNTGLEDYIHTEVYKQEINLDRRFFPLFVSEFRGHYNDRTRHDVDATG